MEIRTKCHPEANGRKPVLGDVAWTMTLPLEDGSEIKVRMGREGRNLVFGMLLADSADSFEPEPPTGSEVNIDWVTSDKVNASDYWWWWNGDPNSGPVPVHVQWSGTSRSYFASAGQLGWNRSQDLKEMGGYWCRPFIPELPKTLIHKSIYGE